MSEGERKRGTFVDLNAVVFLIGFLLENNAISCNLIDKCEQLTVGITKQDL